MSDLLGYKKGILYGPVNSRRLGKSLGINLLPAGRKTCNFNCLYCQYGWTEEDADKSTGFPSVTEVINALKEWNGEGREAPDSLTFSGNGEPTLYPHFTEIVDEVIKLRDSEFPDTVISILSNSTRIIRPEIRKAVRKLDNAILKLDCAVDQIMKQYSGPNYDMDIDKTVEAIGELDNVILQALFSKGVKGNLSEDHINIWLEMVKNIDPQWVMLYTLHRAFPSEDIEPVSKEELELIQTKLSKMGVEAKVY